MHELSVTHCVHALVCVGQYAGSPSQPPFAGPAMHLYWVCGQCVSWHCAVLAMGHADDGEGEGEGPGGGEGEPQ